MSKSSIIFKYSIAFFILFLGSVIFYLFIKCNKQDELIAKTTNQIRETEGKNALLKNIVLLHGKCIDLQIPNNVMVTDIKGDRLLLKKLIEKPATIYRINETNCFTCVEKFLPELEKMAQKSDVIILGTYSDPRNLFLALKNYVSKKIKIYNIEKNSLAGTKIEGVDIPYIFDIDPELKSSNFFIPQKEIPELSSYYQMNHY